MDDLNFEEVQGQLQNALTEFDNSFTQTEYPEIVIGDFVDIVSIGGRGNKAALMAQIYGRGSLDDGLIGDTTSSIEAVDVDVSMKQSPIITWAKGTTWNIQALYEAQQLGLPLDTVKLENLRRNSMHTIQKTGFLGHARDSRITGLLTSPNVAVSAVTPAASLKDMTAQQARDFFAEIFVAAYNASGGNMWPDTMAIDGGDLATLALKEDSNVISLQGLPLTALDLLTQKLGKVAGRPVSIKGIPNQYAQKVPGLAAGKHRAAVYTRNREFVKFNVPVMPETLGVHRFNILTFQSALYARFGGVDFIYPELAAYADYTA